MQQDAELQFELEENTLAPCMPCNAEDFTGVPIPENQNFCFLCKYGGLDGIELEGGVNEDVKKIEGYLKHLRKVLGPERAAREMKVAFEEYKENCPVSSDFLNDPEWTEQSILDHMVVHAVPEAIARGENPDDYAYEIFSKLLKYQTSLVVDKKSGLVDEKQLKNLCTIADRVHKFAGRGIKRKGVEE